MTGIYEKVLGEAFDQLHPEMKKKFGLQLKGAFQATGKGYLTITGGKGWQRPLWHLGAKDHLFFPERGERVPFSIVTKAYQDEKGIDRVAWTRRFHFQNCTRAFDAVMYADPSRRVIMDDLGISGRITSSLRMTVSEDRGLRIVSDQTWLNVGSWKVLLPQILAPQVIVNEHYDEKEQAFHVQVDVKSRLFGRLISYEGYAHTTYKERRTANDH
ncbi:DUF4166 domain-containing protein [Alteribacter aurantiacus]|uniref:DUF4166 domain-containing protein n=1 Tax=Alteribacter aurantiacus TaxID=254410 RepID=UPI0003F857E1|nr:DUF4166 domain-containing protein [Alteribacter aurantiacus]